MYMYMIVHTIMTSCNQVKNNQYKRSLLVLWTVVYASTSKNDDILGVTDSRGGGGPSYSQLHNVFKSHGHAT